MTVDELFYLKEQFAQLEPNKNNTITLENIRMVSFSLSLWDCITECLKCFSFNSSGQALMKNATDAMKESRIPDFLSSVIISCYLFVSLWIYMVIGGLYEFLIAMPWQLNALQYRRMDFEEFCAATLSVHQLEALDRWEQHARCAYELFEKDGNRAIVIEELASVSWNFLQYIMSCGNVSTSSVAVKN